VLSAVPSEIASLSLPTPFGEFQVRALQSLRGIHLCLIHGDIGSGVDVLVRLHSECVTGDSLGSLRCDCRVQLQHAFRAIAAEGRGVLVYSTGHEGRGIGLAEKLRAYVLQDGGLDTVDANEHLGFRPEERDLDDAATCLSTLGIGSVRLITNNPAKIAAVSRAGISVTEVVPIPTAAHARNVRYLTTKEHRMGHGRLTGSPLGDGLGEPPDVRSLLGSMRAAVWRPFVVVKYAQTLDGRIATKSGDARWISGRLERTVSHALRAACDGIAIGVGTAVADDPLLTVRMVPGASPIRVVFDSTLRIPDRARILDEDAATLIVTSPASLPARRKSLRRRGIGVLVVPRGSRGIDLPRALEALFERGLHTLLVEGGARVITSFLNERLVDRIVVSISPRIIGSGTDAINDLGVREVAGSLRLSERVVHVVGDDVLIAGDLDPRAELDPGATSEPTAWPARAGEGRVASPMRNVPSRTALDL
jgi:GTP cyclohydrolase II